MKPPFIHRPRAFSRQQGVTMVLVAIAMVAIIAMAAISIDVITLYLAREEAQRSADAAALAAARVISLSGVTGDPGNTASSWQAICGGTTSPATEAATTVALQNVVGGAMANTVTVTYGGTSNTDCSKLISSSPGTFSTNPTVTVQVQRTNLPNFFSRIWSRSGTNVSASATAEVFNPSYSGSVVGNIVPVQPSCVKPWAVPNQDPLHPAPSGVNYCTGGAGGTCDKIVSLTTGQIANPGISFGGSGVGGILGETFWLSPDCLWSQSPCNTRIGTPQANYNNGRGYMKGPPNLVFAPGQVGTPVTAVPSCTTGDQFEEAIEGCDQAQNYTCGVPPGSGGTNAVDLSRNPDTLTADGVSCLIHQAPGGDWTEPTGQDYLSPFAAPSTYPFQILPGAANPLVSAGLASGNPISVSPSIVSLPIYDETSATLTSGAATPVTFVGFLQVFINAVDQYGNVNVTVLNVVGCSINSVGTNPITGTSPVPIRLVTLP
jgi:Flp pilus assembly protein TadG